MEYLHVHRITHRDLKPKNILLRSTDMDRRGFTAKVRLGAAWCRRCRACDPRHAAAFSPAQHLWPSALDIHASCWLQHLSAYTSLLLYTFYCVCLGRAHVLIKPEPYPIYLTWL